MLDRCLVGQVQPALERQHLARMVERRPRVLRGELPPRTVDTEEGGEQNHFSHHPPHHRRGPRGGPPPFPRELHLLQCLCPHTPRRYRSKRQDWPRPNPDVALGNPRATLRDRTITPLRVSSSGSLSESNLRTARVIPGWLAEP